MVLLGWIPCILSAFHQESWEALQTRPGLARFPR